MTPTGTAAPSATATVVTAGNDTPGEAPRTDPGAGPGAPTRGRLAQIRAGLTRAEWASILGMAGFVAAAARRRLGRPARRSSRPHHYQVSGTQVFGVGLGLTAYTLGMRHAFDADHIAAIDNTTRKLMADGKRPVSVGFWFSLGHSSIVFGLVRPAGARREGAGRAGRERLVEPAAGRPGSSARRSPGVFLYPHRHPQPRRAASASSACSGGCATATTTRPQLEEQLNNRGFMNRILGGATRAVPSRGTCTPSACCSGSASTPRPRSALLVLAGGAAAFALPWYAILTLPILFAAGMSLLDSIDGCFMNFAYGWAFSKPVRKVYYNITITGAVGRRRADHRHDRAGLDPRPTSSASPPGRWPGSAGLDLNYVGYAIVGAVRADLGGRAAVWRFGRIEARWNAGLAPATPTTDPAA